MYKRIALRSSKDVRRRCQACSTKCSISPRTARTLLSLTPYWLQPWADEPFFYSRYRERRSTSYVRSFSDGPEDQKKNRIELSGRSLLFSLPTNDDEESSDDEEEGSYTIGRPMFTDNLSSLGHLKAHYLNDRNVKLVPSNFNCTKVSFKRVGTGCHHAWTCVFTCPITGVVHLSGRLRQLFSALDEEDVPEMYKNTVLYSKRRGAEHAAAARALDVIQYERTGLTEPRFCEGDPVVVVSDGNQEKSTLTSLEETVPQTGDVPPIPVDRQSPTSYYFGEYGVKVSVDSYATDCVSFHEAGRKSASTMWTSVFTCPVSERQFLSGTVTADNDLFKVGSDKRVFYRKKIGAERAATRRAIDVLRFEKYGILEPRNCLEDPSIHEKGLISHEETKLCTSESTGKLLLQQPLKCEANVDFQEASGGGEDVTSPSATTVAHLEDSSGKRPSDDDASSVDSMEPDEEDSEEEYVVAFISHSIGTPPSQRLLHVASHVVGSGTVSCKVNGSLFVDGNPTRSVVDVANAWLSSTLHFSASNSAEKGNPHRLSLPRNNSGTILVCGKTILASLAAVSQTIPVGQSGDIEPIAKKVIDALWNIDRAKPDTDVYTLYLKCLDARNPKIALEKAETIVEAMVSRVKHKSTGSELPKPNQHTFNALIQISAQIGGTSGRIAKHTDQDFAPDRESFLAVLSSSTYNPAEEFESGQFDPTFATECIQRMSQLAVETTNPCFLPDTQVYNAPIRWSGGPTLWTKSRPYARYIPWESYESIYSKSLRENVDKNDFRLQEARDVEEWLDMMHEASLTNSRVAPDIETYEAAIQCWLRTCTREGLDRAEVLLRRLLQPSSIANSVQPRLQTFHPFIAAWYHSQHSESSAKCLELIHLWEDICSIRGSLLDVRLIEMKMIACLSRQRGLMNEASRTSQEAKLAIVDAARQCSTVLVSACGRLDGDNTANESNTQHIAVKLFTDAIQAWENVATVCLDGLLRDEVDLAVSEMINAFTLYERLLQLTISNDTGHGVVLRGQEFSVQLEHFILNSHTLFGGLVDALAMFGRNENVADSLLLIEKMTRIMGEFDEIESHCLHLEPDNGLKPTTSYGSIASSPFGRRHLPDDDFSYQVKGDRCNPMTRNAFLWKVIRFMEQVPTEKAYRSDMIRLATLVRRIGGTRRRSSSKMDEAIDTILDRETAANLRLGTTFAGNVKPPSKDATTTTVLPHRDQRSLNDTTARRKAVVPSVSTSPPRARDRRRRNTNSSKKINGSLLA